MKPMIDIEDVSLTVKVNKKSINLLDGVSLKVLENERVGVIGRNGAGKTVLLKVASGIYSPTRGFVNSAGKLLSVFSVSSGGNKNWTGRQNAEMKLLMYGVEPSNIESIIEEIEQFAKIGEYFDLPVKIYSAGMAARLAFAIVTSIRSEILILDEWISVGDASFKEAAAKRFSEQIDSSKALLFCTHSPDILRAWATKVVWVESGKIMAEGNINEVLPEFHSFLSKEA